MNIYTFPDIIQFSKDKKSSNSLLADMNQADSKEYTLWSQSIENKPSKFHNLPMKGFKIVKEPHWNVLDDSISITHPTGFTFSISSQNFLSIFTQNSISDDNLIMSPMILCYQKNNQYFNFHLVNQAFYEKMNSISSIATNQLVPGQQYFIQNEEDPFYYLGHMNRFTHHFESNDTCDTILLERKRKSHLFYKNKFDFNYIKGFPLNKVIKTTDKVITHKELQHILDTENDFHPMKDTLDMFSPQSTYLSLVKKHLIHNLLWSFDFSKEYGSRPYQNLTFTNSTEPLLERLLLSIGNAPSSSKEFRQNLTLDTHLAITKMLEMFFYVKLATISIPSPSGDDNISYKNNKHIFTIIERTNYIPIHLFVQDISQQLENHLNIIFNNNYENLTELLIPLFENTIEQLISRIQQHFTLVDFSATNNNLYTYNFLK